METKIGEQQKQGKERRIVGEKERSDKDKEGEYEMGIGEEYE